MCRHKSIISGCNPMPNVQELRSIPVTGTMIALAVGVVLAGKWGKVTWLQAVFDLLAFCTQESSLLARPAAPSLSSPTGGEQRWQGWSHIPVPGPKDPQSNYCKQQKKSGSEVEMRRATSGKDGEGYCQETLCTEAGGCAWVSVAVGGRDGHGKQPPVVVLSCCCLAPLPVPYPAARGQPEAWPLSSACRLVGRFLVATGSSGLFFLFYSGLFSS